jgi:hypothetical protein
MALKPAPHNKPLSMLVFVSVVGADCWTESVEARRACRSGEVGRQISKDSMPAGDWREEQEHGKIELCHKKIVGLAICLGPHGWMLVSLGPKL